MRLKLGLLVACLVATVASYIGTADRLTWFLEAFPVLLGVPVLVATHRRFPLTPLLYVLIFIHALVLLLGAHYTYAEVPLGFWMRDAFGFERNHYDRIGHFMQGFEPAILAREILIRNRAVNGRGWLFLCVTSICLAFSACYEFFEWWTSVAQGSAADAFLGTQGDVWDTQWDMFMATLGAISAQLALGKIHDGQLEARTEMPGA
ncbi:Inner membrane protein YjdF [Anaerolineae bacterium]|nr:Inner membrane protein YjdF [Anaerolineae bacterium]